MSSRVNLGLLVDYINGLPKRLYFPWDDESGEWMFDDSIPDYVPAFEIESFLDPDLKFKFLCCGARSTARPPLSSHIPLSFFSFDVSTEELKKLGRRSLRGKVDSAFEDKVSTYVDLLKPTTLPEDVLYFILPYIYGGEDCLTGEMLAQIVATAKKLLAEASPSGRASSFKGGHKRRRVKVSNC